jgi:hypothetical protein
VTQPNPVIIAGAMAVQSGAAGALRNIAARTDIGVLNTWTAKGLFPWNHPAHLGTMGLQERDVELAHLSGFDDVILCGVTDDELPRQRLSDLGVLWRDVSPSDIGDELLPIRSTPTPRPPLFDLIAAVCQPLYADESVPMNPARAASDLAAALPDNGVVCGDANRSGFWLGRSFPTRVLGSVQLPTRPIPGFAATQAAMARRTGRFGVAVVDRIDASTEAVMHRVVDLVVEVWTTDGPALDTTARAERLHRAHAAGGVQVIEVGLRFEGIDALVAVAGEPLWHHDLG